MTRPPGSLADYLLLARFNHSTKHVFIVPGAVLALLLRGVRCEHLALQIALGLATAVCIASANYVINEWLDRHHDRFHPVKSQRTALQRELSAGLVLAEWALFLGVGLACAALASRTMLLVAVAFALQGVAYNLKPLRTKDLPYLDVISESVNNPLRLMIGWAMVDPSTLPPSSLLLAYWLGGAFLMAAKRLSEFREMTASQGHARLTLYRQSFAGYSEGSLTLSCFVYGMLSSFFLAVFLIKYRVEYLLLMPVVIILFAYYLAHAMQPGSSAQHPEKLHEDRGLVLLVVLLVAVFVFATVINIPWLGHLSEQHYISLE
jgi:4-hydroxybenzoate polyprenyltransferase